MKLLKQMASRVWTSVKSTTEPASLSSLTRQSLMSWSPGASMPLRTLWPNFYTSLSVQHSGLQLRKRNQNLYFFFKSQMQWCWDWRSLAQLLLRRGAWPQFCCWRNWWGRSGELRHPSGGVECLVWLVMSNTQGMWRVGLWWYMGWGGVQGQVKGSG